MTIWPGGSRGAAGLAHEASRLGRDPGAEHVPERSHDPPAGLPHQGGRVVAEQLLGHARHHHLPDAARDDEVERIEVGRHVEREAVQGHPLLHVDADARDLAARGPHAGQSGVAIRLDAEVAERLDQHVLEPPQVPVEVLAMCPEVEDRIADQLARTVEGHVAAALDLDHLDPAPGELRRRQRQAAGPGPAAERDDRRVLHQQQHVLGDLARDPLPADRSLSFERLAVGHRAEIPDLEPGRHAEVMRRARRTSRRARAPANAAAASRAGVPSAASSRR